MTSSQSDSGNTPDRKSAQKGCWQRDYPIKRSEKHRRSRRQFLGILGLSSIGLVLGSMISRSHFLWAIIRPKATRAVNVARLNELEVGGYKLFDYPQKGSPCILIRLETDRFVAFSQSCTHLMCPVHFAREKRQLVCPCHERFFSAENGRVLAGPPPKPLPQFPATIDSNGIWVHPTA